MTGSEALAPERVDDVPPGSFPIDMPPRARRTLARWLSMVTLLIVTLSVVGGWVRLTRSGLSIVEWQVVTGVVPPLSETQWRQAFADYRATPEYRKVHFEITLAGFKRIYLREWFHRFLGRLVGLLFVAPLVFFLARGTIPLARSGPYAAIALGFALQGVLGWYMVKSGLIDRPSVSHYRLAAHLLAACVLIFLCLATCLRLVWPAPAREGRSGRTLSAILLAAAVLQMTWGALTAGLKAGYVSDTFPLMYGHLIPPGWRTTAPLWSDLTANPIAVHFVHRWLGFLVVAMALAVATFARTHAVRVGGWLLLTLLVLQIGLGASVVLLQVPLWAALTHQATGLLVFVGCSTVFVRARWGLAS